MRDAASLFSTRSNGWCEVSGSLLVTVPLVSLSPALPCWGLNLGFRLSLGSYVSVLPVVGTHRNTSLRVSDFEPSDVREDARLWEFFSLP